MTVRISETAYREAHDRAPDGVDLWAFDTGLGEALCAPYPMPYRDARAWVVAALSPEGAANLQVMP